MEPAGQARIERRLAAILAADVVGYSRLIEADEEGTLGRLKALRAQIINPKIASHKGRIVKPIGDGLLVEFSSVVDAVRCAAELQSAMAESNRLQPPESRIDFRIGIHQGDIVVEDGDIFGDGVNIAARLEGLAEPGRICVSARVREDVAGRLDLAFEDIGEQSLKNITRPVRVFRVVTDKKTVPAPVLALPDKPSIAVLPFANLSGDPEQEYFADGMVEDITTALSKLWWFFVIARNSSFTYKDRAVDVKQAGRELGVRYVFEGSVRKGGNRLRITAQLVEAESGNHVWAKRYDRDLGDIFAVQDEITERVVAAIEPELYAAEHFRSQRKPPESLNAWECVIRALSCIGQGTREANTDAEALCRRAIAITPDYGQAHSLLAWVLLRRTSWSGGLRAAVPEISTEVQAALGLDDHDAWAQLAQGILFLRLRRFDEAVRALRRTVELNPNFALGHGALGLPLALHGAQEEAISCAEYAQRLSPNDRLVGAYSARAIAFAHFTAGRYAECAACARYAIDKSPEDLPRNWLLTSALAMLGEMDAAAEARATLLRLQPKFSLAWMAENVPFIGEPAERLREGLRKAGVPEE
ncbi:MAG: tetratricopeptide repeat protein [Alphaproteobacteria bacterium]|nr:tetratricopeptide repeat protein [Alphaproteobacteria bacterium]